MHNNMREINARGKEDSDISKSSFEEIINFFLEFINDLLSKAYHENESIMMSNILEEKLQKLLEHDSYVTKIKHALTELQNKHKDLLINSYTDSLTELYNQRFLEDNISSFLDTAAENKAPVSCFVIDLDDFKEINDTYGHVKADEVLKISCKLIKSFFRKKDLIIRHGGDEILIYLYGVDKDAAIERAESIRQKIENNIIDKNIKLTVSIGVSTIENVNKNIAKKLFEEADKALYKAKSNGKNRVEIFTEK